MKHLLSWFSCLLLLGLPLPDSEPQPVQSRADAQARAVLEMAIQSMGGQALLNVRTMIGKGKFSQFNPKGDLVAFSDFVDYIVYPDRERTEFGKGKKRYIQTNVADTGWIYDGEQKAVRDQKPEQIEMIQRALRRNLDNVLRRSRQPDVTLRDLGEKELWPRQRGRGVQIRFPLADGSEEVIELYVDPLTHKPVRIVFQDKEEQRFFLYREFDGVLWPVRIDQYKDGVQSSRIAYDSVSFNQRIDPRLFDKPEHADKIK